MREIKFRAWDRDNAQLIYDWQIYPMFNDNGFVNDLYKVMQYTWLKDRNWKEIYEGDLIWEIPNDFADPTLYEVVYHAEWFYPRNTFTWGIVINRRLSKMLIDNEVKWNIYENPEIEIVYKN